ncbi:Hypothetical predicted protein [Octopus vulgaris]|uniref:Uncharacterized protein n=1 Tax=Octopus vulgaris TaxID=6645 RepID=A0AA36BZ76_OCTVU|nr:Hypothetical predicted protein [Octopus vulgaris]
MLATTQTHPQQHRREICKTFAPPPHQSDDEGEIQIPKSPKMRHKKKTEIKEAANTDTPTRTPTLQIRQSPTEAQPARNFTFTLQQSWNNVHTTMIVKPFTSTMVIHTFQASHH